MKMMWGVASNQHAPNPERATMGLFHEGDVVSAIAAAKAKGAPLLVFILGDDPSSAETVRALSEDSNDGSGATLRSEAGAQGWVALRLTEGGTDAPNFRALCPAGNAPVAVAVDARTGAKIGEASGANGADVMAREVKDLREAHEANLRLQTVAAPARLAGAQTPATPAPATQPAPAQPAPAMHEPPAQPAPAPRTDDPPQDETSRDETSRDETSRDASSAAADADAIFAKAKAEAELAAARAEMAARIKADAALKRAAAIEERAKKAAEAEKRREDEAKRAAEDRERRTVEARERLGVAARIQLPDGTSVTARLPAGATIGDVRDFLVADAPGVDWKNLEIWNAWPRCVVDESDPTRTVAEDLSLGARPSLLAIHRVGVDGGLSVTHRAGPGGALEALLGILRKIWALVRSFLGMDLLAARGAADVAAARGGGAAPRGDGADGSDQARGAETAARRSGGGGSGNVHTLGGLRDDADEGDDGRNRFWNGNSTQFGGGPADADPGDAPMDGFYTSRNE